MEGKQWTVNDHKCGEYRDKDSSAHSGFYGTAHLKIGFIVIQLLLILDDFYMPNFLYANSLHDSRLL